MHRETLADLIDAGTTIIGSLGKEELIHRREREAEEQRHEQRMELIRVQNEAMREREEAEPLEDEDIPPEESFDHTAEEGLEELIEAETCSICKRLLEGLRDRPYKEQYRGIMEYGQFKRELADDADIDELKASLRQTEVLNRVFEEDIRGAA